MKVLATVLSLSLLLCAGAPVEAAPARGQIVLKGDRNTSIEVTLPREIRLTCCEFKGVTKDGVTFFKVSGFQVESQGTYSGFAIERVSDGRVMKGAVWVPDLDLDEGRVPTVISFGRATVLQRGRYRIHLLTDGPSTVRITANGLERPLLLRPEESSSVNAEVIPLLTEDGSGPVQARVSIETSTRSTVLLATKTEAELGQAHLLSQCLTEPGGHCTDPSDTEPWVSPASGGGGGTQIDVISDQPSGTHEAVFTAVSAGLRQGSYGFVLVFN
jgi:hypothetical protein